MKTLKARHHIIMARLLTGQTQRQIANALHMNEGRLSLIVNAPLFKAELDRMQMQHRSKIMETSKNVAEIFDIAAPEAAKELVELVRYDDPNIRMKAAEKVVANSTFGLEREKEAQKPIQITQQQMVLIDEGLK